MNLLKPFLLTLFSVAFLSACANQPENNNSGVTSYLNEEQKTVITMTDDNGNKMDRDSAEAQEKANVGMEYLSPLKSTEQKNNNAQNLSAQFNSKQLIKVTSDDLALKDYIHYVFGELLNVSYILDEKIGTESKTVTLNLKEQITQQKLFLLSEELLIERGYTVRFDDGIYYIHLTEGANQQANVVYGYGQSANKVPNTSSDIIQLVPFKYGVQTSLANSLRQILKVDATPDFTRNALILKGKRKEIIRALEFIQLMDQPVFKNREIGVYKSVFINTDMLVLKLTELLKQDGITISPTGFNDQAISIVELNAIGTLVFFANTRELIERVNFWAQKIDLPPNGDQLQYFIYQPQFARASDLGEALQALIGGGSSASISSNTSATNQNDTATNNRKTAVKRTNVTSADGNMSLVVDNLSNALIFNATGDKYRQLLPLIQRLDVMPKQVILEVIIAEVKLTDNFKQGVEFALTNRGDAKIAGGFNLASGTAGLTYLLTGSNGALNFNLLQTNSNINVLSRPSLLVRDGVTANILVGDEIPTVGEIVSDSVGGSQTSVVYRKTGVELTVTPTINARGVVIMEIEQKISNQSPSDDTVAGSPAFFERSIKTEVVAESGHTIILGGLISETRSKNNSSVPFFSNIPLVGNLFNTEGETGDKNELVVLVTPKVIESSSEWDNIKAKFSQQLTNFPIK